CLSRAAERIRRVRNLTPRASSSPRMSWVVTFWSMTSIAGSVPATDFQWSQKASTSRDWVALEMSAFGVDQVVGAGVLAEEGQPAGGALGGGGPGVLPQHGGVPPVQEGVEAQVEDGFRGVREAGADHFVVQGGEEPLRVVVGEPVGVVGQRGF